VDARPRRPREVDVVPDVLELRAWQEQLCSVGLAAGEDDVIIPGVAAGGHYTLPQRHNFIRAVKARGRVAADRDADAAFLVKATPYSLRRGHISQLDMRYETPEGFTFDGAVEAARSQWPPGCQNARSKGRVGAEPLPQAYAPRAGRRCLHSGVHGPPVRIAP
jgi:hypothetical protein